MKDDLDQEKTDESALHVMDGVDAPPALNPDLTFRSRVKIRRRPDAAALIDGVRRGDRVLLSQAITLIESERPEDRETAAKVLEAVMPEAGCSLRIGITGVPGVGKSTFIESFGLHLVEGGHKLAVLAVDPSSERSHGSILGDKTRMELLSRERNAYIRPTASGATLGGVARHTRETILLVEAAGFDRILIETVGVGQSEVIVHSMVDFFMLLSLPGAGDELQGMKRGIMEMADGIVITKADGDNIPRAKIAAADLNRALHLFPAREDGWTVPVRLTSAMTGEGLVELASLLEGYTQQMTEKGFFADRRRRQALFWMQQAIDEHLKQDFERTVAARREEIAGRVESGAINPFEAAERLIELYHEELRSRISNSDNA